MIAAVRSVRCFLVVGLLLATSLACDAGLGTIRDRGLLQECEPEDGPKEALCGRISVYEDRELANGRMIDLNVVVYPARDRDPKPDPVFVLTGGPGTGAAQMSSFIAPIFRQLRSSRDLVFVDQRGTGESNGLPCEPDTDDLAASIRPEAIVEAMKGCLDDYDADLRLYTTPIAMDDLDEVRATLGYGQINLWGGSYGTRAAQVFLRRHGEHVRTVVLDGAVPLNMVLPESFADDAQRALDVALDACEAQDPCRERFPDLRHKLDDLLDRLEREPARVRAKHPRTAQFEDFILDRRFVAGVLRLMLYRSESASMIPVVIEQARAGDFGTLLALAAAQEIEMDAGMAYSVLCAEDLPWVDGLDLRRNASETFLGESFFDSFDAICSFWPRGEIAEGYHEPVRSDVPAMILSGALDPVTPPHWGTELAESLSNVRHIVVPGVAHGTSGYGCLPDLITDFVDAADASVVDAKCVDELTRPPFFATPAGPRMKESR